MRRLQTTQTFASNNDLLSITRPEIIEQIHTDYEAEPDPEPYPSNAYIQRTNLLVCRTTEPCSVDVASRPQAGLDGPIPGKRSGSGDRTCHPFSGLQNADRALEFDEITETPGTGWVDGCRCRSADVELL